MGKLLENIFHKVVKSAKKEAKKEAPNVIADAIIRLIFFHRNSTDMRHYFSERWFKDLHFQRELFRVEKNILTGSYFHNGNITQDKIIIFSCTYSKGYHYYLDFIHYFTSLGYLVFSYDNTATDESDGLGIKGFPQAIVDLKEAIEFVKRDRHVKDEQLILIGHGTGGYAAGAITKEYKNIKKVVLLDGFDTGSDLLKLNGHEWAKQDMKPYLKYIDNATNRDFPLVGRYSVSKSIRVSKGEFLIIHSDSDVLVPLSTGAKLIASKMKNWKKIDYIYLHNRGHYGLYYDDEALSYQNDVVKEYNKLVKVGSRSEVNKQNQETMFSVVNKDVYLDMLDKKLLNCIISFINK